MKKFLCSPIPKANGVVQCFIRRNKNGANKLFPVYSLYLKEGEKFLLASKKRPKNKTSNYLISMSETDLERESDNYLGKLRSNFIGTEFQIYDDGENPEEAKNMKDVRVRRELAAITYTANLLGTRGPRKMQVAIPVVDAIDRPVAFTAGDANADILGRI
jgi:tubby-related protein 1